MEKHGPYNRPSALPDFGTYEVNIPHHVLDMLYENPKQRSYSTWFEGHRVWVKRRTTSAWVEVKRGYEECAKSS